MKSFVYHVFNFLRTLSFLLVVAVFSLWVYDKAREDYSRVESELGMQMLTGVEAVSPFSISDDAVGLQSQSGRIPINKNGLHLFFAGEEFVYSDHTRPNTVIYLQDGTHHTLKGRTPRETLRRYLEAAGTPVSVEQSYVINLDHIRKLESKKSFNGKSYLYRATMTNGTAIAVSQKSFPEIKKELVKNAVRLVNDDQ